jgi:FMN phosphatase YigB (HAD superfamily)
MSSQSTETRRGTRASLSIEPNMNLTLLLDLDNTLLDSSMDTFLPAYFQALSGFLKDRVEPELMLTALLSGTRKMMANVDPTRTLQEVFDSEFFPKVGMARDELQPFFDQFYEEVFPSLRYLTSPRPEAIEMIAWALEQGIRLAIATNPLFPMSAIHHRMRWAGLPPEEIPFSVVSAYETFHFAKPNPAYFAEVLGRMGWPEGPVVMVGDDIDRDLPGSFALGLPTYWINTSEAKAPAGIDLAGRGSIADLRPWLESTDLSTLEPALSTPESLIALLLSTPAVVSGLLIRLMKRGQPGGADLKRRPFNNEWSLTEILCHLRDTELEINLPRLRMLLELEEPFIPARDSDSWAITRDYQNQDASRALDEFCSARIKTVELLRGLSDEWKRKARHAIFGPTDLRELVKFMAEHDKLHIRQIRSTVEHLSG